VSNGNEYSCMLNIKTHVLYKFSYVYSMFGMIHVTAGSNFHSCYYRDAAWEREPNAFQDLLIRYSQCDVDCMCPHGREYERISRFERLFIYIPVCCMHARTQTVILTQQRILNTVSQRMPIDSVIDI